MAAVAECQRELDAWKELLKLLKDKDRVHVPELTHPLEDSEIGRQPWNLEVMQVIDDDEMIAKATFRVLDYEHDAHGYGEATVWIQGVSTAGLVDGQTHSLDSQVMRVSGNRTYTNVAGGSNTIFVLEPFDLTPFLPTE